MQPWWVMASVRIATLLGIGVFACSGASAPQIADPIKDASTSDPSTPFESATATSPAESSEPRPDGGSTRPADDDKHAAECAAEAEDNGAAARANTVDSCMKGELTDSRDNDFFRVVAPDTARTLLIAHKESRGRVRYHVTEENGPPVVGLDVSFTDQAPEIEVAPKKAYIIQLAVPDLSGTGGARGYEFKLTFL